MTKIWTSLREAVLGVMLLLTATALPAAAADNGPPVSYDSFHDRLAGSGNWIHDSRWGDVWRPNGVGHDWRPYFDGGHWAYTADYGWFWDADAPWGDVTFHYGRWVFDPAEGWVWLPGYVWAPAWVYWRFGDGYVGWMPAAPDADFLAGIGIGLALVDWGPSFYGYGTWYGGAVGPANLWVFVGGNHFADADFRRFAVPRAQSAELIARTRNVTRYSMVHGIVANRSIRVSSIEHLSGHAIRPVAARTLLHSRTGPTRASLGRAVAAHERSAHPIPAATARQITAAHRTATQRPGVSSQTRLSASHRVPRATVSHPQAMTHHYAAHRPGYAAHRPSYASHRPSYASHRPATASHRPSFASHGPQFASHRPNFASPPRGPSGAGHAPAMHAPSPHPGGGKPPG